MLRHSAEINAISSCVVSHQPTDLTHSIENILSIHSAFGLITYTDYDTIMIKMCIVFVIDNRTNQTPILPVQLTGSFHTERKRPKIHFQDSETRWHSLTWRSQYARFLSTAGSDTTSYTINSTCHRKLTDD